VFWRGEQGRWPLWLPVGLGAGTALYFALPFEPPPAWGWAALASAVVAASVAGFGRARAPLALVAALLMGFGLAKLRETSVATPVLPQAMVAHLTGRVRIIEPRPAGPRIVLENLRSGAFIAVPHRVRVALRGGADIHSGDWLSLTARLDAPPAPVEPGASDLGRNLYFQSIGAVGFAYGRARRVVAAGPPDGVERWVQGVEDLRERMARRIQTVLPGSTGGIAAALVTGTRGGISDEDEAALRDAGLAHVLAIAGLHMALIGGGLFWLVRACLAAVPVLALNYPIKKWAAGAALPAGLFYLAISGAAPSSVRAFVMFAVAMCAVLLDRPAVTMRGLALAACMLLLARPESIADPGFQMSFAAVAALVAVAEWAARRPPVRHGMVWRHARAIIATSLVGSLATLPFALFFFGRATHYAVLGNLIAMPVMGFWVMPSAAFSVALMPLGWDAPALQALGAGITVMVAMGRWVSGLPGAVSLSPAMPLSALVLIALGGLWCAIWQRRPRWWGLIPLASGVALACLTPRPDMLVAPDGVTVAIRGEDGRLAFPRKPKDKFVAREWLRRDGDGRDIGDAVGMSGLRCDGVGCAVTVRGVVIALSRKPEALAEDCARAAVLVSAVDAGCQGPAVVIGAVQARVGEGWRVTLGSTPHADSVRAWRGQRPWVPSANNAE
jgi:competence protein ComEC